jgi:Tol biopolymer transport system component
VAPLVADAWLELPVVATALAREARRRSLDERVAFERLAPALELARRGRDARAARAKVERERRDQDGRQEQGQLRKHLLGSFFAEEYWVGAGPEQDVVLMALPALDRLAEDGTARFERQAEHEQLLRARADGSERRPLLETYNIFSFPSVSANGARVAAVLDHRQWSKSIAVLDVGDGRVREVVNHRSHYFSSPILAPDGSALLFWSSVGRDGEPSLERAAADGSGRRTLVPAPFIRMDVPAWSADGQSVYLSLQAQDEQRSSLWRLDPSTGERALLLGGADAATASSWLRPTPTPDGRELVLVEQDDSVSPSVTWVGSFALPSGPYRRLVQLAVGRMAVSPDSRQLACETSPTSDPDDPRADDTELALVPLGGGEPRLLTRNRIDDSLAGWSRDGRKLYLHQRDAELEGGRASHRIYWLEP